MQTTLDLKRTQKEQLLEIFDSIDFQKITDHPNILIAAKFWDQDRYCAARICYKFMRAIDDLIDNYKAANKCIAPGERKEFIANVDEWMKMIIVSRECNPEQKELLETIDHFRIPIWPLEAFAKSMIYDINYDGFPTFDSFLEYSQGASVAPASIFVHLNGLTKKDGRYEEPAFNVKDAATPCAIFSYIVHIIRDFQKDQINNLNYFADNLVAGNNLTRTQLRDIAHGSPVNSNFRNLIADYYLVAEKYRVETKKVIKKIDPLMEPPYRLSLEIIFDLYLMVFERIDIRNGSFTAKELNPTPEETRDRVFNTILNFR